MPERPTLHVPPQFAAVHPVVTHYLDSLQQIPASSRPDGWPMMAFSMGSGVAFAALS
ncbi:hypothetical protein [Chitinophaga pinensis]|uniref:hypothetical protein n=1 Tax=Chitinophaga pinensis TaxID=79329 RepID=UPI001648A3BE|nr:hypothetical protein [Chitinophaga pinensis]